MKTFGQLINEITNVANPAAITGLGNEPPVHPEKKKDKFAGCSVFDVTPNEYAKCMRGRMKFERWGNKLNMEDAHNSEIRSYSHKNPGSPVIVRNQMTGEMSYLIPKRVDENSPNPENISKRLDDLRAKNTRIDDAKRKEKIGFVTIVGQGTSTVAKRPQDV